MHSSKIYLCETLPKRKNFSESCVILFDEKLQKLQSTLSFINQFQFKIALTGGEGTKSLDGFKDTIIKVHKLVGAYPKKNISIICLGGGSIGDLAGFVASVYKRGVNFIQIPTTWLSAIDSAHGGKNAINLLESKNQIGTVYLPSQIYLVKNILTKQPRKHEEAVMGEVLKMALLDKAIFKIIHSQAKINLWELLPSLIKAKTKYFKNDLFEKNQTRIKLNLGHSLGHAIELENNLPHGIAVGWGLVFALELSKKLNFINKKSKKAVESILNKHFLKNFSSQPQLNLRQLKKTLKFDKKNTNANALNFVLVKEPGNCVVQNIGFTHIEDTLRELKWV
ncbi:MAG: 3-dehydroquinate synthase [Oligoflexia bacterium]|nr:3-dehydroquinate synthase [Oligoflexia bacterium]